MPRYCFIDGCRKTSYKNPNRKLIRFPKNTKTFLCDEHFPSDFFGKKKLKESSYAKIEKILIEKGVYIPLEALAEKIKKNKRKYSRRCVFKHCRSTDRSIPAVKFLIFPKENNKLFEVWVDKCDLSKKERAKVYKYVCERHFMEKGDEVPNCNLTAEAKNLNYLVHETVNDNETDHRNGKASEQTNLLSRLNLTLIEDFTHCHSIKEEPELSIVDV